MAACSMAKLRVECSVAGWAPGVRTMTRRVRFHSMTGLTGRLEGVLSSAAIVAFVGANQRQAQKYTNGSGLFFIWELHLIWVQHERSWRRLAGAGGTSSPLD